MIMHMEFLHIRIPNMVMSVIRDIRVICSVIRLFGCKWVGVMHAPFLEYPKRVI